MSVKRKINNIESECHEAGVSVTITSSHTSVPSYLHAYITVPRSGDLYGRLYDVHRLPFCLLPLVSRGRLVILFPSDRTNNRSIKSRNACVHRDTQC